MNETTLVGNLLKEARRELPHFTVFKHTDRFRHGVPDMSITGNNYTTWWEVKYADPTFDSTGIQELTMKRLDSAAFARYIIFVEQTATAPRHTRILTPARFAAWREEPAWCDGFDYAKIALCIWDTHRSQGRHA